MNNFFDKHEQADHLAILACQGKSQRLLTSKALTEEERDCLEQVEAWCDLFSKSVFKRFGLPYQRKLLRTLDSNDLLLVGKNEPIKQSISMAAQEDLAPLITKVQSDYCFKCKGDKNHLECAMYACAVTLGIEATPSENNCCPYWDGVKIEKNSFDEELFDD